MDVKEKPKEEIRESLVSKRKGPKEDLDSLDEELNLDSFIIEYWIFRLFLCLEFIKLFKLL